MSDLLPHVHRAFQPGALNPPSNRVYAKLDAGRGCGAFAERIAQRVVLAGRGRLQYIAGPPGCGKSTELRRLQRHLVREEEGEFLVVFVDLAEQIAIRDVTIAEVVWLVATAIVDQARVYANSRAECTRFQWAARELLADEGDTAGGSEQGGTNGRNGMTGGDAESDAEHLLEFSRALRHSRVVRERWRAEFAARAHRWNEALVALVSSVAGKLPGGAADMAVLIDGLDQLDRALGPSDGGGAWRGLLTDLEAHVGSLGCHAIATVPYAALLGGRVATLRASADSAVELLPDVRLRRRDGAEETRTIDRMGQVASRRIRALEVEPDAVLGEAALRRLIDACGGSPGQLVALVNRATLEGTLPISLDAANAAIADQRRSFFDLIREDHRPVLEHVQLYYELNDIPEHAPLHAELFRIGALLCYFENDEVWYGLNPLLHERVR